jgi:hypothetical protein
VATLDPKLRKRLYVEVGAKRLANFFNASVILMYAINRCRAGAVRATEVLKDPRRAVKQRTSEPLGNQSRRLRDLDSVSV